MTARSRAICAFSTFIETSCILEIRYERKAWENRQKSHGARKSFSEYLRVKIEEENNLLRWIIYDILMQRRIIYCYFIILFVSFSYFHFSCFQWTSKSKHCFDRCVMTSKFEHVNCTHTCVYLQLHLQADMNIISNLSGKAVMMMSLFQDTSVGRTKRLFHLMKTAIGESVMRKA